tara:strand:+ start:373 stop:741 length:369 start_codon:yes stop_codon:yes gene_type:complete
LFNISIHGIGAEFVEEEISKSVLKNGESAEISAKIFNFDPEQKGIVNIKTYITNSNECTDLKILDHEITTKQIPKRSLTNPYIIKIQAIDPINERQTCEIEVLLVINENETDRKSFSVNLLP